MASPDPTSTPASGSPAAPRTGDDPVGLRLSWEHTHRELLPAVLLARECQQRSIPFLLEHVSALGREPGSREVVALPFYYDDLIRDRYLSRAEFAGRWLVNLAYEQMHFRCGRGYLLPDGEFARTQVLHCAWGDRFRNLLVEHGVPAERIRLTGHPRFDIYHHRELLLDRAELGRRYALDPDKPWVLVAHNFNLACISERLRRQLVRRKYALTDEFIAGFAAARTAFVEMARRLTREFSELQFILRVHPAGYEAQSAYAHEARTRPNLRLIADYDVANWTTQAALTIVWNSTTSMECMAGGCPVISYEPFPFAERFDYDVNRIIPTFRSVDEVVDVVRTLPEPALSYDWALFEQWYRYRDGRNAARICDIVDEARGDYASRVCSTPSATNRRTRAGRRLERSVAGVSWAGRLVQRLFGLDSPPHHDPPPPGAVEHAARTLSPAPLLEFMR